MAAGFAICWLIAEFFWWFAGAFVAGLAVVSIQSFAKEEAGAWYKRYTVGVAKGLLLTGFIVGFITVASYFAGPTEGDEPAVNGRSWQADF